MKKTMQNSQVALIAWKEGRGFAGEPLSYVSEAHYFNSKKQANEFQIDDWKSRGSPMDHWNPLYDKAWNIVDFVDLPEYRFQMVRRGTKDWKMAQIGYIEEMDRKSLLAWIQ